MLTRTIFAAMVAFATFAIPASAAETVKFGKTCIGRSGSTADICLAFNGKTITSSYKYRGSVPTRGTHTGCSVKGNTLVCTGGRWATSSASGKMNRVTVKLAKGAPVSITWR